MGDEELFQADVATVRQEASELLNYVGDLVEHVVPDEDVLALAELIMSKAEDHHIALQRLDTWRDYVRDKQVNEKALMEALAAHTG